MIVKNIISFNSFIQAYFYNICINNIVFSILLFGYFHWTAWSILIFQLCGMMFSKACESELMHYSDVIMGVMTSQITSVTIVYSTVCWGADQRKHQSFASLAFVRGIHRWPVNSPHKGPVMRKMFPFDDIIMWKYNVTKEGKCYAMLSHSAIIILFPDNS